MTKPSLAKTSLRVLIAIFFVAFVIFLVVTVLATSKIIVLVSAITTALSFALLVTFLALNYFYNVGDKKYDENFASGLFGANTKITK